MITGDTLIEWGYKPGPHFKQMVPRANELLADGEDAIAICEKIRDMAPPEIPTLPLRTNSLPIADFLGSSVNLDNFDEMTNYASVLEHMDVLMRTPVVRQGAIMPDACPAGSNPGTIPVGGVVASERIHPGMHSADVCCSMAISIFKRRENVSKVLDAAQTVTHFGPGARPDVAKPTFELKVLLEEFEKNPFLSGLERFATDHFMTQGDGNHFLYVGELASNGAMAVVTHHGSSGLGGHLYKRGKAAAERHTKIHSPRTPMHNAWLAPGETEEQYWHALQVTRQWTKLNHFAIHDALARAIGVSVIGRMWNEHNFVFYKNGLYHHAKGATPAYHGFADDDSGLSLIPLNMAQPILMVTPSQDELSHGAMGFAPHGAGRNMSRTAHIKLLMQEFGDSRGLGPNAIEAIMARETKNLDVRFYTGKPDVSELPSAYKNATQVMRAIEHHNLARIVDTVLPLGSMMAGEMNWNRRR